MTKVNDNEITKPTIKQFIITEEQLKQITGIFLKSTNNLSNEINIQMYNTLISLKEYSPTE